MNTLVLVNYFSVVSLILSATGAMLFETFNPVPPIYFVYLTLMGMVAFVGQVLLNRGLQLEKAAKAATMNYLQIVFAFVWQLIFLNEPPNIFSGIGAAIIFSWSIVIGIKKWKSTK